MACGRRSRARVTVVATVLAMVAPRIFPSDPCSTLVPLYHYTNKEGYDGIVRSGAIRPSVVTRGDACYGKGVYCTSLPPKTPFYEVLMNNYDQDGGFVGKRGADKKDRADYVVRICVDPNRDDVRAIVNNTHRSVWIIGDGQDVGLAEDGVHGLAEDVADLDNATEQFQKLLRQDELLASLYAYWRSTPHTLQFWHMDKRNFLEFPGGRCKPDELAQKVSWVNRTRYWSHYSHCGWLYEPDISENDFVGFDRFVVLLGQPRLGPELFCLARGDMISVLVRLKELWHTCFLNLQKLEPLAPKIHAVQFLRDMTRLLDVF